MQKIAGLSSPSRPSGEPVSESAPGHTGALSAISAVEAISPLSMPTTAPVVLKRRHHSASSSAGKFTLEAKQNAMPTSTEMLKPGAAGERERDRQHADPDRRDLRHPDLLLVGVAALADDVGPQVVGDRAGGGDDEPGDDREDRGERDRGDDGEEDVAAGGALAAAEVQRQLGDREVAGRAGRLRAGVRSGSPRAPTPTIMTMR